MLYHDLQTPVRPREVQVLGGRIDHRQEIVHETWQFHRQVVALQLRYKVNENQNIQRNNQTTFIQSILYEEE